MDQPTQTASEQKQDIKPYTEALNQVKENIGQVIIGKEEAIEGTIITFFGGGHLLIEDVPGVAKTMLARSLAKSVAADFQRVQCTPDLLPSDITGVSIFNQKTQEFEFRPGPIFTDILLTDEINRTSPRTQSALLEAMAEQQVSLDESTRKLEDPFFVIATQNPIEHQGTYPLPEAQRDRFLMRIQLGYPDVEEEVEIMDSQQVQHPIESLEPVMDLPKVLDIQEKAREVFVHQSIRSYIAKIVNSTRESEHLELGSSPRGSLFLMRAAQVKALIDGKFYVSPDFIKELAPSVLGHRVILKSESRVSGMEPRSIIEKKVEELPVPVDYRE